MRIPTVLLTTILATGVHARHLSSQEAVSVTDSAGVRIVESSAPAWSAGGGWRVGTEPLLTIGEVSGDLNYLLERVSHALRLEDGTIVVADRGPNELRLFDAAGVFIQSLGGRGEGPGEFAMLSEVWARGDTILASDGVQSRISVFGRGGNVLETIRVEVAQGRGYRTPETQFSDGAILVLNAPSGGVGVGGGDVIPGAVWRLDRYSRAGRFMNEISSVQESPRWEHGIYELSPGLYLPFSLGLPLYAASGDHVYTAGGGTEASIQRWKSDGGLSHVFRWAIQERRVSNQDRRRWREANSTAPQGYNSAAWARYVREIPFPERMPLFGRLLVDAQGNVWAKRFSPSWEGDSSWYVFDGQGVWFGEVSTPPGLYIFEIGADYVLGLRRDELGVQFVVLFPLDREPAPRTGTYNSPSPRHPATG